MHHRQLLYTFYYFLLFMDDTYTRPLIEPRESMVGGLLLPQLFLRQMEIEAQACQKGWQFWIQDELRNARTKPHVNGKGARGWFNHRLDLFRTSHNPSRTVAMDVPNHLKLFNPSSCSGFDRIDVPVGRFDRHGTGS